MQTMTRAASDADAPETASVTTGPSLEEQRGSIDFHLHLAQEAAERIRECLGHGMSVTEDDLSGMEAHLQILDGAHPEQHLHIPKPAWEAWTPKQSQCHYELQAFSGVLRRQMRRHA